MSETNKRKFPENVNFVEVKLAETIQNQNADEKFRLNSKAALMQVNNEKLHEWRRECLG